MIKQSRIHQKLGNPGGELQGNLGGGVRPASGKPYPLLLTKICDAWAQGNRRIFQNEVE